MTVWKNTSLIRDASSAFKFQAFRTPRTVLRLNTREAELLRPYFQLELDRAIANFFRRVALKKAGQLSGKVGYPRFKSRKRGIGSDRAVA